MSEDWALMTRVEQVEKEKQGLSLLQDDKICCGNCQKNLIGVVKVKEGVDVHAIKVLCPYCGDSSFRYKVTGKIYLQAEEGLHIADAPVDIKENIKYSTISVKKDKDG